MNTRCVKPLIYAASVFLLLEKNAQAYIDPNSAGLLYQIFFPIIVAVTLAWRWVKESLKALWSKLLRRAD